MDYSSYQQPGVPLTGDDVAAAEYQIELAGRTNREAIEWAITEHAKDPQAELPVIAALVDFANTNDPDKIAVMWAELVFRVADQEAHSNG